MIQFLLAAPRSGSGKTTMTCALLMALKRRGHAPCAFKSGPDYIDPMFHRAVLGVESRSLDLFFSALNFFFLFSMRSLSFCSISGAMVFVNHNSASAGARIQSDL